MKIQSSFLFLALMSTIELCQSDRFKKFKIQHIVDENDMNKGCDYIIEKRNILDPNSDCKTKNTFIIGLIKDVISVCKEEMDINGLITSVSDFETVVCELIGEKDAKPCKYNSQKKKQKIRIACENGKPVHLEGPEKLSNNQEK
ncbi:hypothetical protein CHARACLAT_017305 [Characodon lateralis]|uniref:Ribonuclease A-domain domain-containing protein n=1 Tax=Characodon lateralis TaxID=208331 RepID=A0ABU7E202_9TELE|nr:hypothetical protein [Characodon lateralis]